MRRRAGGRPPPSALSKASSAERYASCAETAAASSGSRETGSRRRAAGNPDRAATPARSSLRGGGARGARRGPHSKHSRNRSARASAWKRARGPCAHASRTLRAHSSSAELSLVFRCSRHAPAWHASCTSAPATNEVVILERDEHGFGRRAPAYQLQLGGRAL